MGHVKRVGITGSGHFQEASGTDLVGQREAFAKMFVPGPTLFRIGVDQIAGLFKGDQAMKFRNQNILRGESRLDGADVPGVSQRDVGAKRSPIALGAVPFGQRGRVVGLRSEHLCSERAA